MDEFSDGFLTLIKPEKNEKIFEPRFEIYLEFNIPPKPDKMVFFKSKIELPTNTFIHEWSLAECESEAECEKEKEKNETEYDRRYGVHIPYRANLIQCFRYYEYYDSL